MILSVVIPVFHSEKTLNSLYQRLRKTLGQEAEIVFVDDGSRDSSSKILKEISKKDPLVKAIFLTRNFGQINAILAGLKVVTNDFCVLMDDDLQHPPEEIPLLLQKLLDEDYDFIYGISQSPKQNIFRKFTGCIANFLARKMTKSRIQSSSFVIIRKNIVDEIIRYEGPFPYLMGLLLRVTDRGTSIPVQFQRREQGVSQYNLTKLFKLWLSGMTNFSILPLRMASLLGFFLSSLGLIGFVVIVFAQGFLTHFLPGWTSLIAIVLLFSGVQLIAIGIVGEYIGRIFLTLNQTPQSLIREKINC